MISIDAESLKNEWQSLYGLFANDKGIRLRLSIPDTVLLQHGVPMAWYFTSKEGYVMQYAASRITIQAVHDAFLRRAEDAGTEAVAIARGMEGLPRLLPRAAFAALCNRLAVQLDRSGAEMAPEDMPVLLQAYFKPSLDLRFVTSFTNDGASVTCHTFQRRYSTRYLPFWGSSSPGALAMPSAGGITDCSPETPGVAAAVSEAGIVMVAGGALGSIASAACAPALSQVQHRQKQHHPMAELSERERVDLGRSPGPALGPVDPALKMALRKAAQGLVQYVQRAHLLTLRSLVCEFARDCSGTIHFLAPLRADWASIIPGHGGEPWAAANLTAPAVEEESWCAVESRGIECAEVSTVEAVDMQQQQQGNMAAELPSAGHTPSSCGDAEAQTELQQEPGSPLIAAVPAEGADPESQQQQQQQSPLKAALAMESPLTTAPAAASVAAFRRSPGVLRNTLAPVPKSPAQLASHLTRELVAAQDELVVQTDLAEQLAARVASLEHDKAAVTDAFERVLLGMQADMRDVKCRLDRLAVERDGLTERLAAAQASRAAAEAEQEELRSTLERERAAALAGLGTAQTAATDAEARAVAAEAALALLSARHREEQAVVEALRRQIVFFTHGEGDGWGSPEGASAAPGSPPSPLRVAGDPRPELRYAETLAAVEELLGREAHVAGERYSLAKVLHTVAPDLHAIFLHYCLLDLGYARRWPPALTLGGWLAFMKETGATNLVPGTRTRSETTIHVAEATELFRRFALRTAITSSQSNGAMMRCVSTKSTGRGGDMGGMATRPSSAVIGAGGQQPSGRPPSPTPSGAGTVSVRSAPVASTGYLSFQGFCAALVAVAAKTARQSGELLEACPFLSEQLRAYVEAIASKAQRVAPIAQAAKKGGTASSGNNNTQKGSISLMDGTKDGIKVPVSKRTGRGRSDKAAGGGSGGSPQAMAAIAEASVAPEDSLRGGLDT